MTVILEPDGLAAISGLTSKQKGRLRRRVRTVQSRDPEAAYVTCDSCARVGFDFHAADDPDVTPCSVCGHLYATLACPPVEIDRWWS